MDADPLPAYSTAEIEALVRLRYWQQELNEMLKAKTLEFPIPVHLAIGHEAAAVAVDQTMQADDVLCLTHRNGCYNLARSKSLEQELRHYRLADRHERPQMGSMNLAMASTGIVYSSSILGNNLAVGSGIAMNRQLQQRAGVVFIMTGDGAMEEGIFWESLIFARSHHLPILVVVENNDFSLGSTIEQRRCPIDLSTVCAGLCIEYRHASGADYPAARAALGAAREAAAQGPAVVELSLKTFNQHAGATPGWATDPRSIDIREGLLMGNDPMDPLVQLQCAIGTEALAAHFASAVREVRVD